MNVSGSPRSPTARRRNTFLPIVWPDHSASLIQKYPKTAMKPPMMITRTAAVPELVAAPAPNASKDTAIRTPVRISRSRIWAIARVPRPATW